MNTDFAKEVGFSRYVIRRILWRLAPPSSMRLPTGVVFPTPREKFFSSDVFVTRCNVDWNSEYILASFLQSQPSKKDFLDVGAHIGYYSSLLSPYVRSIWAFEPDERNFPYLKKALAGISHARIVGKAVSDKEGNVVFSDQGESSVSHIDPTANQQTATKVVPVVTIDSHVELNSLSPIAIKIDIEGFDILALKGATKTAGLHHPVFLVEYNQEPDRPNTWKALGEFVKSVDYSIFAVSRKYGTMTDYEYRFSRHSISELENLDMKMLFLVPENHLPWFRNYESLQSRWNGNALRPKAIHSLLAKNGRIFQEG